MDIVSGEDFIYLVLYLCHFQFFNISYNIKVTIIKSKIHKISGAYICDELNFTYFLIIIKKYKPYIFENFNNYFQKHYLYNCISEIILKCLLRLLNLIIDYILF